MLLDSWIQARFVKEYKLNLIFNMTDGNKKNNTIEFKI